MLPNLDERVKWYQEHLKPEDPTFGNGIADWTITTEYRADLTVDGSPIWGCMCSPSALPDLRALTPEDIANRRAHIVVRPTSNPEELGEIERTIMHEIGHILVAPMQSTNRDAEENAMHSLDALFGKHLSPEQRIVFARAMQNPKARAYRASNGGTMPDPTEDKKKEKAGAPPKQQAAPRDVATIQAEIVKAAMANQPTDELVKELVVAMALAGTTPIVTEEKVAPVAEMGMKPEEVAAYRKKSEAAIAEAGKEAIEVMIEANPHLDDKQKTMMRKQSSAKDARELVATYKPAASAEMGMKGHPSKQDGKKETPFARAMTEAANDPVMRSALGLGSSDDNGLRYDVPGKIVYTDGTEELRHQKEKHRMKREARAS